MKILEVNEELIDYRIDHGWCTDIFIMLNYKVDISVVNEGSESISGHLLLRGAMPQAALGGETAIENAKLLYIEVLGKETKKIQEIVQVNMFAIPGLFVGPPEIEFSIITDLDEIRMKCPVCQGKGRLAFTDWLRAIIQ